MFICVYILFVRERMYYSCIGACIIILGGREGGWVGGREGGRAKGL